MTCAHVTSMNVTKVNIENDMCSCDMWAWMRRKPILKMVCAFVTSMNETKANIENDMCSCDKHEWDESQYWKWHVLLWQAWMRRKPIFVTSIHETKANFEMPGAHVTCMNEQHHFPHQPIHSRGQRAAPPYHPPSPATGARPSPAGNTAPHRPLLAANNAQNLVSNHPSSPATAASPAPECELSTQMPWDAGAQLCCIFLMRFEPRLLIDGCLLKQKTSKTAGLVIFWPLASKSLSPDFSTLLVKKVPSWTPVSHKRGFHIDLYRSLYREFIDVSSCEMFRPKPPASGARASQSQNQFFREIRFCAEKCA